MSRLIVAIPAYNEKRVRGKVIKNLRESLYDEEDYLYSPPILKDCLM